jgi:hypothetical protein
MPYPHREPGADKAGGDINAAAIDPKRSAANRAAIQQRSRLARVLFTPATHRGSTALCTDPIAAILRGVNANRPEIGFIAAKR